jgi:NAD(P)H-dependent FMN reductase
VLNPVIALRLLERWMRAFNIKNQSSVPMAYKAFDKAERMRPSAYYDRVVNVMEELRRHGPARMFARPYIEAAVRCHAAYTLK